MAQANLKKEKWFYMQVKSGRLKVTKSGRVFNTETNREFIAINSKGYRQVSLQDKLTKKVYQVQLHRLVWVTFNGLLSDARLQINHLDGVKKNCSILNLELTDNTGNSKHAHATGLHPSYEGEKNSQSRLSDKKVAFIRKKFAASNGKYTVAHIASIYKLSVPSMSAVLKGYSYKHVVTGFETKCRDIISRSSRSKKSLSVVNKIRKLREQGLSSYAISSKLCVSRNTVMKYWL